LYDAERDLLAIAKFLFSIRYEYVVSWHEELTDVTLSFNAGEMVLTVVVFQQLHNVTMSQKDRPENAASSMSRFS